jgi:hypothetical protein
MASRTTGMRETTAVILTMLLYLLALAVEVASAEPSAERDRLTRVSLSEGLGARTVPLLEVVPPESGRDGQLDRVRALLAQSPDRRIHVHNPGRSSVSDRSTVLFAADESWYLEVMGDGSRFRYRGNIDDPAEEAGSGGSGPLDLATLERLGRAFIADRLAPLIPRVDGEALVFLGSRYLREGSTTETEPFTTEVKANIAIFGRAIDGVFVAGPGSKVTIWFSTAGEPVAFFADWPTYRRGSRQQETLDIEGIRERVRNYADKSRHLIARNLTSFECGYVDLGVFKRRMGLIQTGCLAVHRGPIGDFHYGAIETIPIGVAVVPDPQWPVTGFVVKGRRWDPCKVSKEICDEPDRRAR